MLVHKAVQVVTPAHFHYLEHRAALNAQLARTANQVDQIAVQIALLVQLEHHLDKLHHRVVKYVVLEHGAPQDHLNALAVPQVTCHKR